MRWTPLLAGFCADAEPRARFLHCGLCAAFGAAAGIFRFLELSFLVWPLVAACYLFGGFRTARGAVRAARGGGLDINVLMILAALVSAALGHWDEGAILLFLFSLSDALEAYSLARTRRSIRAVMELRPSTAWVSRGSVESEVPIGEVIVGDRVRVRTGERYPVDGVVLEGFGAADESLVTGESMPVEKAPGDNVFAGAIHTRGMLWIRATQPADSSTIDRIVHLVEHARESRIGVQRVIERWQTPYVYLVLAFSGAAAALRWLMGSEPIEAIRAGMVLLVAASPCAVVLASPVAVLATVTRAAKLGILFKGGTAIERLAAVDTMALDKTGTVTRGQPTITAIVPGQGMTPEQVLALAAALESQSVHPYAAAIVQAARQRGLELAELTETNDEPGLGVTARWKGDWVGAGRRALFDKHQFGAYLPAAIESNHGEVAILVASERAFLGELRLRDEVRGDAIQAIEALRGMDIRRVAMLTGDRAEVAEPIARRLGVTDVIAGLKPEQKLKEIERLLATSKGVAMVGDGVNDAPAIAGATVGVAMGAAGTELTLDAADVALMRNEFSLLAEALHLARTCKRVIQQSLAFAFAVITILVGLTLSGNLSLALAVVGHEGSTVLVMLNGLRILLTPRIRLSSGTSDAA